MQSCPECEAETTVEWLTEDHKWGRDGDIFSSTVPVHTCVVCKFSYTDCVASDITTFDQFQLEQSKGIVRKKFYGGEEELWERAKNDLERRGSSTVEVGRV